MRFRCSFCGMDSPSDIPQLRICGTCGERLAGARSEYAYPAASVSVQEGPGDLWLVPGHYAIRFRPDWQDRFLSSLDLDLYHRHLLNSSHPHQVLAGLASVVYWGFFSGADGLLRDGRARARAKWFLQGRSGSSTIDPRHVFEVMVTARQWMANRRPGRALAEIARLKELGQVAFASKVVTFLDPELAAIYDSRIGSRVEDTAILYHLRMNPNGGGVTGPKQGKYQQWCEYCLEIATHLNQGIWSGKHWQWTDWDLSRHLWRAVDVERALFVA